MSYWILKADGCDIERFVVEEVFVSLILTTFLITKTIEWNDLIKLILQNFLRSWSVLAFVLDFRFIRCPAKKGIEPPMPGPALNSFWKLEGRKRNLKSMIRNVINATYWKFEQFQEKHKEKWQVETSLENPLFF